MCCHCSRYFVPCVKQSFMNGPMWWCYCYYSCYYWRQRFPQPFVVALASLHPPGHHWNPLRSLICKVSRGSSLKLLCWSLVDLCFPNWMEWMEICSPQFRLLREFSSSLPTKVSSCSQHTCSLANPDYFILVFSWSFWPRKTQKGRE